ncbi:competence type IV pilus ATPase ComGA [Leuconostoc inhae]|uniref:competence type IV pilus ATPase ComGA n=1 Tax=Leuconostoc inhae TaxID=178001 RepID=UPI001C7D49B1|nr:competence type IV pilus ATPase ComGA [Leuconostoc inhae]
MNEILNEAIAQQANDIYILPINEAKYVIKFHVDGKSYVFKDISEEEAQLMVSAIKYRAKMNISERRRPQLGRFQFDDTWIRVSTVGDFLNRETVVLRMIYQQQQKQQWLDFQQFQQLESSLPNSGLLVISGPTGSGKTTTLYRLLDKISDNKLVLTIEDPVEIQQPKFIQLQVNDNAGIDYDELIKVALRHRPEVLLVGEIRDGTTAKAAVQAALSGHLVLSTVHAMSARDVILRLRDLGVDKNKLAVALSGVVYQRLLPTRDNQQAAIIDMLQATDIKRVLDGEQVPKFSKNWQEVLHHAIKINKISKETYQAL